MNITFVPVTKHNAKIYIATGIRSYREHYLHLWENNDPSPFINSFLSLDGLIRNLKDPLQRFFIIKKAEENIGILNFSLDVPNNNITETHTLLLNKLYLLGSAANKGVGSFALDFVETYAHQQKKEVIWLYAMKKGKPKQFYSKYGYQIITDAEVTLPHVLPHEKEMWLMAKFLS